MKREDKIKAIIRAEQNEDFTPDIYNIEMLEHNEVLPSGKVKRWKDRYDCLEIDNGSCFVWFIAGTGHEDLRVPIESLTDKSLNRIYDCIGSFDTDDMTVFEVETEYKSGRKETEHFAEHDEEEMWRRYDLNHRTSLIDSSAIVDSWPA